MESVREGWGNDECRMTKSETSSKQNGETTIEKSKIENAMAWQVATQSPVEILIQEQTHSGGGERVLACFSQQRNDLFVLYAGKAFQKLLDRIAASK